MSFFVNVFFSITGVLTSLFPFVVLLGILVFIHEFGHFITARLCGVRVEVFSLGFGKKLLKWKRGDTVYCVSLFPLGGYVKMFGHEYEKEIEEKEKPFAFLHKKLWQKTLIVLAGPLMNFFLAGFIFAGLSMAVGERTIEPVIGEVKPDSQAGKAGLAYGDHIISIDKVPVKRIKDVNSLVFKKPNAVLSLKVKTLNGETQIKQVSSTAGKTHGKWGFLETGGVIEGLEFSTAMAGVGVFDPLKPAGKAGLKTFDKILSVNGEKIKSRKELFDRLSHPPLDDPDFSWEMKIQRGAEEKTLTLQKPRNYKTDVSLLGLAPVELFIADLRKGGAAEKAGLRKGDFLFKVDGKAITSWSFFAKEIKNFKEENGALNLEIIREGKKLSFSVTPEIKMQIINGVEKKDYMLGVVAQPFYGFSGEVNFEKQKNPLNALAVGFGKTFHWCAIVGIFIGKLVTGKISRRTLGGAISIGREAYNSYSYGLTHFFSLMAILSVQLFLLNILPIPLLDGGHLFFYAVEFFNGAPLSMKKMIIVQKVGLLFLLFLLIFTTFNDLHNWLFVW